MYVIKKMQLNQLKPRPIVSNRALFAQYGQRPATVESQATADCYNEPTPYGAKKTQLLALGQKVLEAALMHKDGAAVEPVDVKPTQI